MTYRFKHKVTNVCEIVQNRKYGYVCKSSYHPDGSYTPLCIEVKMVEARWLTLGDAIKYIEDGALFEMEECSSRVEGATLSDKTKTRLARTVAEEAQRMCEEDEVK